MIRVWPIKRLRSFNVAALIRNFSIREPIPYEPSDAIVCYVWVEANVRHQMASSKEIERKTEGASGKVESSSNGCDSLSETISRSLNQTLGSFGLFKFTDSIRIRLIYVSFKMKNLLLCIRPIKLR